MSAAGSGAGAGAGFGGAGNTALGIAGTGFERSTTLVSVPIALSKIGST